MGLPFHTSTAPKGSPWQPAPYRAINASGSLNFVYCPHAHSERSFSCARYPDCPTSCYHFRLSRRSLIVLVRRRTSEVQVLKLNRTWPVKPPGLAKALNLPGIYEVVRGARGHQRRYRHSPGKIFWRARAVLAQSSERLRAKNCRKQRNRQEHSTAQSGL